MNNYDIIKAKSAEVKHMQAFNDETGALIPEPEEVIEIQEMAPVLGAIRDEVEKTVWKLIMDEIIPGRYNKKAIEDAAFSMSYV